MGKEPLAVDKKTVHEIRKELRPEYENMRKEILDALLLVDGVQQKLESIKTRLYAYTGALDKLLERLEQ